MKYLMKLTVCLLLVLIGAMMQVYAQKLNYASTKEKVYLHTSHVFFTPGEDLFYKIYVVDARDQRPAALSSEVFVEIISPAGTVLEKQVYRVENGYAEGAFHFSEQAPGGIYKLHAYTSWMQNEKDETHFTKEITLLKVIPPRVLMKLDFPAKGYGPGDKVIADYSMRNLQQEPVENFQCQYRVAIDGRVVLSDTFVTDTAGKARIVFRLPDTLATNDGLLNILVDYRGNKEAISRSIPITLSKIDLQFMPEGGTLVNGIHTNIAFRAVNEYGKGTDIKGVLMDDNGKQVATFESLRFGMGAFAFTPKAGQRYTASIQAPAGIKGSYVFPQATDNGVVMNIYREGTELLVKLKTDQPQTFVLEGKTKNVSWYKKEVSLKSKEQVIKINPADFPAGIAVFTLSQPNGIPLAERLVFLHAKQQLQVSITTDKNLYEPREEVTLTVSTKDQNDKPVPSNLSLAVIDDKKWSLADDRQDHILSWLLLSSELQGKIEEPPFYFKEDEPAAPAALDLVMLTHGYRYFDFRAEVLRENRLRYAPNRKHRLVGRVVDKYGKSVESTVLLFPYQAHELVRAVKTDPTGKFVLWNTAADSYVLVALPFQRYKRKEELQFNILENTFTDAGDSSLLESPVVGKDEILELTKEGIKVPLPEAMRKNAAVDFISFGLRNKNLSEVIITGYGTSKRAGTAGCIMALPRQYYEAPQSAANALQGRVAGLSIVNGTPGNNSFVTIRGTASLTGNNEPLYVYNGVPVSAAFLTENLADIESITVLKDAAAVALYGSKAANGVIVVSGRSNPNFKIRLPLSPDYKLPIQKIQIPGVSYTDARRFYAPVYTTTKTAERNDFRETIYWNPVVQTDKRGTATVTFYNSDASTAFRAIAEGIGYNGKVGRAEATYASSARLAIDVKIPPYLTVGDKTWLPLVLSNNRTSTLDADIRLKLPQGLTAGTFESHLTLAGNSSRRVLIPVDASAKLSDSIRISIDSRYGKEEMIWPITVAEKGFPVHISLSGNKTDSFQFWFNKPVPGSLQTKLNLYSSTENLTMDVLEGMLREPHGCFEQTSSTTYPNIYILKYLKYTAQINQQVEEKVKKYLTTGYNLLKSYETTMGGFEWFGRTPPQEVLTAYGLMEFMDMKEFIKVDEDMIARTKKFLLDRRDGKGGFNLEPSKSFQFRAVPYSVANAYIVYAMVKAGMGTEVIPEYEAALTAALKSNSLWELAVMAITASNMKREKDYDKLMVILAPGYRNKTLAKGSMVGAQGTSLNVETKALCGLAFQRKSEYLQEVLDIIGQITKSRSHYGFGSTQSTLLSLELLTEFAIRRNWKQNSDKISFMLNKESLTPGQQVMPGLKEGENKLVVTSHIQNNNHIPYNLDISYYTLLPENNPAAVLKLQTSLSSSRTKVGETVRMNIRVQNESAGGQPMSVAKIGIPAGLSAQPWQLKELIETAQVAHYEVFDNYLVFYWMGLDPHETREIHLDLKAEIAGNYKAKASTVYPYYMPEARHWQEGISVLVSE
ncbi:TonB-dependent receptor plug domain-containing protein [Chitinophaga flava]|uniref:Alpha-2-macroglobulin domain-containing protein n=1 Tax=Chitinophaga flava TaxID=2259036 RepID=A0A365XP24_9BACT|nr:TonB-dependent receptor plug domain-containing protein [Chitinophaga flava]RBL88086.1 hypothetical protein DF182_31665 [Chitinophaga flava]